MNVNCTGVCSIKKEKKLEPSYHRSFASYYNAHLPRFNSKFASPGSCGVDVFAQDWNCEIYWICAAVSLIVRFVRKLEACNGYGTLVMPKRRVSVSPAPFYIPRLHDLRALLKMILFSRSLRLTLTEGPRGPFLESPESFRVTKISFYQLENVSCFETLQFFFFSFI